MKPEELLSQLHMYMGQTRLHNVDCAVGYIKKFKWRWLATQLNTLIFIGTTSETVDKAFIENFSKECYQYALKHHNGWPRGIQSGVGSIAILQAENIEDNAKIYCQNTMKKHWSAFEIPVILDTVNKKMYRYNKYPLWGNIYFPFFTELITKLTNSL